MTEGPYNSIIMDHLTHPRNVGELADPDGAAEVKNPVCGDTMRLFIKVQEGRIMEARFLTFGCGPAIAASSMITEILKNKTIEEALDISNRTVSEALGGLPPTKIHCAFLVEKAVSAAISDYRKRKKN
jgi:nitrogen fixation protein NifU and related proteins